MRSTTPHPTDAELIRFLDGASDRARPHLQACEQCSRRLVSLNGRFQALSLRLALADEPVDFVPRAPAAPAAPRGQPWLRAAVFALLLLGGGAAGWAAYRVLSSTTHDALPATTLAPPSPALGPPTSVLAFVPDGASLTIIIAAHQQQGVLRLARHDSDSVLVATPAGVPLGVTEGSIEIRNQERGNGDYRIAVPAGITQVLLVTAGDSTRVLTTGLRNGLVVPLSR